MDTSILIFGLVGYVFGSIPFGLVLCYLFGYGDIRKIGSGNIGATNVLRTGNKLLALLTLILDSGKGAIAVFSLGLFNFSDPTFAIYSAFAAGLGAILGHLFPVWLKFKGGKGVATTLGTLLAINPIIFLCVVVTWLLVAFIFRYSSLAALVAVALSPIYSYFFMIDELLHDTPESVFPENYSTMLAGWCAVVAVIVWAKHHQNIRRLIKGEEPKIGKKKST